MAWHYNKKEEIIGGSIKTGMYLEYDIDVFDRILNDNNWVFSNDAKDEQDWILDQLDKMLESNDGEIIYIPTVETATKIDNYYAMKDLEVP